jgi:hypothetical protein
MKWTRELSSIATAALETKHMGLKRYEADALEVLLGCIGPADASKVAISLVTSVFGGDQFSGYDARISPALNWPRVMYLVRRFCDSRRWSDVSGSERSSAEACLTTALASPLAASNPKRVTVVLAIARFMYRCGRNTDIEEDVERGLREYDRWLGRMAQCIPKGSIKALCVCLGELAPVEPVRYLRSSLKIFSGVHLVHDFVREYTAVVKIRLRELDADSCTSGPPTSIQTPAARAGAVAKAVADVSKFVAEFSRNGGRIPTTLVRLMNFHRYYFRSQLLEHLLSRDLSPSTHFLQREFPHGGLADFNKQRISMLKVMAFDRKDKAVTEAEARSAMDSIRTVDSILRTEGSTRTEKKSSSIDSPTESSPIGELISSVATIVRKLDSAGLGSCRDGLDEERDRICRLLATRLAVASRDDAGGIIDTASSFLCSVLDCVGHHSPLSSHSAEAAELSGVEFVPGVRPLSKNVFWNRRAPDADFQEWARITCSWLRVLLCGVVADCRLARFRRALQGRLLLAICVQCDQLSQLQVLSCAVVIYAISGLSHEDGLHDLTIVMVEHRLPRAQEVSDIVAENLCVDSPAQIRRSSQYAIFYARLVMSQPYPVTFERWGKDRFTNDRTELLLACGVGDGAEGSATGERSTGGTAYASLPNDPLRSTQESDTQCNYLPSSLILLLRWVSTCPWRLLASDAHRTAIIDSGKAERQKPGRIHCASFPASDPALGIAVTREIIELLQSPCCSSIKLDVGRWTWYEIRAGSGRVQEAEDILFRFAASSCKCHVLAAVARSIVKYVIESKCERDMVGVVGSWLQMACLVVANDQTADISCPSCRKDRMTSNAKPKALDHPFMEAFELCSAEESDISFTACSAYIDILRLLPPELYFGCAPSCSVHRHLSQSVIPVLWPLSEVTTKTFSSGYIAWELRRSHQETRCEPPLALSVACATYWNSLERAAIFKQALSSSPLSHLLKRAKALIPVVTSPLTFNVTANNLDVIGGDSLYGSQLQPLPNADGASCESGLEFILRHHPAEAGAALASGAMRMANRTSSHQLAPLQASMRLFLARLTSLEDRRTLEILDVIIDILARYPMAKVFRLNDIERMRADDLSMAVLIEAVRARLAAGPLCPTFLRNVDDARDASECSAIYLVREEMAFGMEPVRCGSREHTAGAKLRDSKASSSFSDNEILMHSYTNARVIIAISQMDCPSFQTIKNATGLRGWQECIDRVLRVYIVLRRVFEPTHSQFIDEGGHLRRALSFLEGRLTAAVIRIVNETADFSLDRALSRAIKVLNPALWAQMRKDQPEFAH